MSKSRWLNRKRTLLVSILFGVSSFTLAANTQPLYKNPSQPIEARVQDLLSRMTLEEKVLQLQTIWEARQQLETDDAIFNPEKAPFLLGKGIGEIARPNENKTEATPNKTPLQAAIFTNAIQKWVHENTRLGIPVLFHEEALHGHAGRGSTSFPQAIGLASTWDPKMLEQIYSVVAQEIRARGAHQALAPILDVARDPRWGRIEETMGEDPYLIAEMGAAAVKGFQGGDKGVTENHVIATLKHLAGHGEPTGGLNIAPTPVGEHGLREIFLFPFEAVVKSANPQSVMASYNEIDGVPSHANGKMLQGILRNEWGFNGILVSDYHAIKELVTRHQLVATKKEAALLAFNAGVDVDTPEGEAYKDLIQLVQEGKISENSINIAVARVLKQKFALGLFEDPYVSVKTVDGFVANQKHVALAQKAAEQSIVLLKNQNDVLPLNIKDIKSIAVIGPHVNETLLGGYSDVPKSTVSILQGIKNYVGKKVSVNYARGTQITVDDWVPAADSLAANTLSKERWGKDSVKLASEADNSGLIAEAVAVAQQSDVAVVVVGDNEATSREAWADNHLGDRAGLDLIGQQQALVDAVLATGKPTVVVLNNGRPLSITKIAETAPAIIEAWYLGQETGTALARVLFGEVNPGGKLPISIARNVGQLPVYYNHKPSAKRGYAFSETAPLYPFGYGLSYTRFNYSNFSIVGSPVMAGGQISVSVTVTNTGKRAGDEVVQLYIHDLEASRTRPVKELKGFKRIHLKPAESATLTFVIHANQLGLYNDNMAYVLEPGKFDVMIGSSSQDIKAGGQFEVGGAISDISANKAYFTQVLVK